ncbi:hypothetical protein OUZ56_000824 [Daphnia magna]|uniref:Uncharacterized protein n=1 Tax=Daphnia magna TaxID=35525 RepID=A0ABR0A0V4_9CRUS|nr:hypothetical protein OUZ56_000824 [Daphnia magna]
MKFTISFVLLLLALAVSAEELKPTEVASDQDAQEWHGRRYYGHHYYYPYGYNVYDYYRGPYGHWRGRRSAETDVVDQKTEETRHSGWGYHRGYYGHGGYAYYRPYSYYSRPSVSYSYRYYH